MILIVFHFICLYINTEDRVNYQLRTVTLDHGAGLEGGDGCEVGGAGVEDAASKHGYPAALALLHRVGDLPGVTRGDFPDHGDIGECFLVPGPLHHLLHHGPRPGQVCISLLTVLFYVDLTLFIALSLGLKRLYSSTLTISSQSTGL